MRLLSLKLFNFRQFWGEVSIQLANQPGKNITVIHGNNGAGKTTFLNAFTWVLYEQHTGAFAAPEQHVNQRAIAEAPLGSRIPCWVEIEFEHNGKHYRARRETAVEKTQAAELQESDSQLLLQINGNLIQPPEDPADKIGQVLPESLHRYFFFDGERIERIVRSENKVEISGAIKTLLSVEVIDRAIRHLTDTKRSLYQEIKEVGDSKTKQWVAQKNQLVVQQDQLQTRRGDIASELAAFEEQKQRISQQLLQSAGVKEIQKRRNDLESRVLETKRQLQQSEDKLRRTISEQGYTVFLTDAIAQFRSLAADLRKRGELPAGIKQQFVQDLLEEQRCICGATLAEGSDHREHVRTWLDRAGLQDVEEAVIQMGAEVNSIERQIPEFWAAVDQEQGSIENLRRSLSTLENQLDDISEQLKGSEDINIQGLENRRTEIEQRQITLHREDGVAQQKIEDLANQIKQVEKQIKEYKAKDKQQKIVQRQIDATEDAIARLEEVRRRVDQKFRLVLEAKVRQLFQQISFTPYLPRLTENYELLLIDQVRGEEISVPASTGENQILSLSFIGSIIDRVRYWSKKHTLIGLDSSSFPIVMDSPFGALDEVYRRQIAKTIPELADQLVVLATKTQWRGEVEQEMADQIGKEYVLVYNSPKEDLQMDWIERHGDRYPLVRSSPNEFEWTEVVEVERR